MYCKLTKHYFYFDTVCSGSQIILFLKNDNFKFNYLQGSDEKFSPQHRDGAAIKTFVYVTLAHLSSKQMSNFILIGQNFFYMAVRVS